jgi:hypothetical protein
MVFAGRVLAANERPAERRPHPEDVEVRSAHEVDAQLPRLAAARQRRRFAGARGHRGERGALLLPILKVQGRDPIAEAARRLLPELNQPFRLRIPERLEEDAVEETEDGGIRAEAERDGQHRDHREPGTLAQAAEGKPEVCREHAPETVWGCPRFTMHGGNFDRHEVAEERKAPLDYICRHWYGCRQL